MKTNYQYLRKRNNHRLNIEFDIQSAIGFGFACGIVRKDFVVNIFFICFSLLIEIR